MSLMDKVLHLFSGSKEKNASFLLLLIPILFFVLTMLVLFSLYRQGKVPLVPSDKAVLGTTVPLPN